MGLRERIRVALQPRNDTRSDVQKRSWYNGPLPGQEQHRGTPRFYGGLNSGGIVNNGTGLGTGLDKSTNSFFTPTRIYWRTPLEILCVESWVARNAIDIPNDDMFIRWREHKGDDEKAAQAMMDGAEDLESEIAFNQAMKAADQYGTGVVLMVTAEDTMETPLNPRRIREGDLKALHYFDRHDLSVTQRDYDITSPFLWSAHTLSVAPVAWWSTVQSAS